MFQLGIELFDPGAHLLGGAGGLTACDEIARRAQRLPSIEAEAIEQAVQLLPQ